MSYILDALKKSDMQARQGELPSIHSNHAPGGHGHSLGWRYALFGGAATALVLGASYALLPGAGDTSPPTTIQKTERLPAAQPPAGMVQRPVAMAPVQATGLHANQSHANEPHAIDPDQGNPHPANPQTAAIPTHALANTRPSASLTPQADRPSPPPAVQQPTATPAPAGAMPMPDLTRSAGNNEDSRPPLRSKLSLEIQQALPAIDISGHIYDDRPAARMVFINGHIQHEGDMISPGLKLLAITPAGVELSFRDTRFRIDLFAKQARSND